MSLAQITNQKVDFNAVVKEYAKAGRFMGNVVVTVDGKEIYSSSTGFSNLEHQVKNQGRTISEVGSITKSFTGVAILKLQEQGKLKMSDPLIKFLPAYPNAASITLYQLLTHTAGIADVTRLPNFIELQKQSLSNNQVIDLFKNSPVTFEPGKG